MRNNILVPMGKPALRRKLTETIMKIIGTILTIGVLGSLLIGLVACASDGYENAGGGQTNPFDQGHGGSR